MQSDSEQICSKEKLVSLFKNILILLVSLSRLEEL